MRACVCVYMCVFVFVRACHVTLFVVGGRRASGLVGVAGEERTQFCSLGRSYMQRYTFYNSEEKWDHRGRASEPKGRMHEVHGYCTLTDLQDSSTVAEDLCRYGEDVHGFTLCRRAGRDINVYFEILLYFLHLSDQSTGSKSIYS